VRASSVSAAHIQGREFRSKLLPPALHLGLVVWSGANLTTDSRRYLEGDLAIPKKKDLRSNGRSEMKAWGLTWAVVDRPGVFLRSNGRCEISACRRKWAVADAVNPDRELKSDGERVSYVWLSIGLAWVPRWWAFVKDPLRVRISRCGPLWLPKLGFSWPTHLGPKVNQHPPKHHPLDAMFWLNYGWTLTGVNIRFHLGNPPCRK
jgi:hypothetical protein